MPACGVCVRAGAKFTDIFDRQAELKLDRRFGGGEEGKSESSSRSHGKGKALRNQKRKGKTTTSTSLDSMLLGNQTARTHARTKRNDVPG
jgi:hypothetical protein